MAKKNLIIGGYTKLRLIATPIRPDGTWNRDRKACQQIAEKALK